MYSLTVACLPSDNTSICFFIKQTVSYAASKLINQSNLAEHFCYRQIFYQWPECLQIQVPFKEQLANLTEFNEALVKC